MSEEDEIKEKDRKLRLNMQKADEHSHAYVVIECDDCIQKLLARLVDAQNQ